VFAAFDALGTCYGGEGGQNGPQPFRNTAMRPRDSVGRELRSKAPAQYVRDKPTELTPAQLAHVERRLGGCATIRGTDLHHELAEQYGYTGSYPSFQRQLRLLRPGRTDPPMVKHPT
jgi:hypothetical protein